jgi:hypothetical protein
MKKIKVVNPCKELHDLIFDSTRTKNQYPVFGSQDGLRTMEGYLPKHIQVEYINSKPGFIGQARIKI